MPKQEIHVTRERAQGAFFAHELSEVADVVARLVARVQTEEAARRAALWLAASPKLAAEGRRLVTLLGRLLPGDDGS